MTYDKIVLVTRPTRLDDLVARFNTRNQARFYIEHAGGDFNDYVAEDDAYRRAQDEVRRGIERTGLKSQGLGRELLSTFLFSDHDVVVTLGGNGLVVNSAKYAGLQPILAINPEPARFEGVLLPFQAQDITPALARVLLGTMVERHLTLAEARTDDGQTMLAVNDFFIGARTHVSARYRLTCQDGAETQSSSGIIVSTGVGSSGWLSSVFNMNAGLSRAFGGQAAVPATPGWDDPSLCFVVREPFINKRAAANLVAGRIGAGQELTIESLMPGTGTLFSDGIEDDFIAFNSGSRVHIRVAPRKARLVWT